MSYYRGYSGFPEYVSVGSKRAKAEKKLEQLKKKNPDIQPVIIEGRALAKSWWGKEWNKNLERYADYSNRIGRGRNYVRHSAVLDLKIKPGKVEALVQGSRSTPYSVSINIKPVPKKNWATLKQSCKGKMDSLMKLIAGKFPKELGAIFTQKGDGLFPVPKEIEFDCSCPDWASMCKHVAAALYGIGARLDEDPNLFFVLRKVDINDLVTETLKESKKELLSKAKKKTSRVIEDDSGLSDIFGIDLGQESLSGALEKNNDTKAEKPNKAVPKNQALKKDSKTLKKIKNITTLEKIEQIIRKCKKGIAVSELVKRTGMEDQQVRNILIRLKSLGKIENVSRGIYRWCL
jgi:uncharacterized Zn finger protein